jgi:hypothetical protein
VLNEQENVGPIHIPLFPIFHLNTAIQVNGIPNTKYATNVIIAPNFCFAAARRTDAATP